MNTPKNVNGAPNYRWDAVVVQQDGASPHTEKNNPEILNSAGMGRGWMVELVTQPAQSSDLNVNDMGFFASLKSGVWGMNASSIDELVETIFQQYEEYDSVALERVWQSLFKVYRHCVRWAITTLVWSIPVSYTHLTLPTIYSV